MAHWSALSRAFGGRIAACTQVGGLQAARSLSQQGWFFLECVCETVFTLQFVFKVHLGRKATAILIFIYLLSVFFCFF